MKLFNDANIRDFVIIACLLINLFITIAGHMLAITR